jgi:hypothetical protein
MQQEFFPDPYHSMTLLGGSLAESQAPKDNFIAMTTTTTSESCERSTHLYQKTALDMVKERHHIQLPSISNQHPEMIFNHGNPKQRSFSPNTAGLSINVAQNDLSHDADFCSPPVTSPQSPTNLAKSPSKRDRSKNHTPRPSNSFILYRREKHGEITAQYKGVKNLNNNIISKIVANMWRSETIEVKAHFAALADAEKKAHLLKYPDYKYRPRKSPTKKTPPSPKVKKASTQELPSPVVQHMMHYPNPPVDYPWGSFPSESVMPHYATGRMLEMGVNDRFAMSQYEGEYLQQNNILSPSEYTWQMGSSVQWDLSGQPKE